MIAGGMIAGAMTRLKLEIQRHSKILVEKTKKIHKVFPYIHLRNPQREALGGKNKSTKIAGRQRFIMKSFEPVSSKSKKTN